MVVPGANLNHGDESRIPDALDRGIAHLLSLQAEDGSWSGDYSGPMFLVPMYIAAHHIAGRELPENQRMGFYTYIENVQNPDGSVGIHSEGPGCQFTTTLNYVGLRLIGYSDADPVLVRMRDWILANGTALGCASWGKFILALLNLYDYEGLNPISPEAWLLPKALPVHPSRLWCHCRQVYLPMAYLYGKRSAAPENDLIRSLRREIYDRPYGEIAFRQHRDTVSPRDQYVTPTLLSALFNRCAGAYEQRAVQRLRQRALVMLWRHIEYEDEVTQFIRIGPVNAVLNTIAHYVTQPDSPSLERSFTALEQYIVEGHDGFKMNSYNSTQLWDTAFAIQALLATDRTETLAPALTRGYGFIEDQQVKEELPQVKRHYRRRSLGGWPFSTRSHGWPITDCTAEALKCALALEHLVDHPIPPRLLREGVRWILSAQNSNGGWGTYERQRGGAWLEQLNPSNVFRDIMVDYPYVECTSACIQALVRAKRRFPGQLDGAIDRAVRRGARFILARQRRDGGFEGSWGVCFTYGTWFAVTGLIAAGLPPSHDAITRAAAFLTARQKPDGGFGESATSCLDGVYVQGDDSHVVNTSWALLALAQAGQGWTDAATRAMHFLLDAQLDNGDWPRQSMVGVFNKTTLINYDLYRRYFPIWALAALGPSPS